MVSVPIPVPAAAAEAARKRLWTEFGVEAPLTPWNDMSLLRVSIQAYNSEADIDALVHATGRLLATFR